MGYNSKKVAECEKYSVYIRNNLWYYIIGFLCNYNTTTVLNWDFWLRADINQVFLQNLKSHMGELPCRMFYHLQMKI